MESSEHVSKSLFSIWNLSIIRISKIVNAYINKYFSYNLKFTLSLGYEHTTILEDNKDYSIKIKHCRFSIILYVNPYCILMRIGIVLRKNRSVV